jgi:hypothetical protein
MARFAIGDIIKKDKGRTGTVRAIFTTMAGELCYAVEHEGALDFVGEAKLSDSPKTDWPLRLATGAAPDRLSRRWAAAL